jgi:hypothetical protein
MFIHSNKALFVNFQGRLIQVKHVILDFVKVAKEYLLNPQFAGGNILEDNLKGITLYQQLHTTSFKIEEIKQRQTGRILTQQEFVQSEATGFDIPKSILQLNPFFRFEIVKENV